MDEAEAFLGGGGTEGDDEELAEHRLKACQVSAALPSTITLFGFSGGRGGGGIGGSQQARRIQKRISDISNVSAAGDKTTRFHSIPTQ